MNRIAAFYKVSKQQFNADYSHLFENSEAAAAAYAAVQTPVRATTGSAGYDFVLPCAVSLQPGETVTVPSGIRAKIEPGYVLMLYPRSGLGFKYRMTLNNTVGIIDSDYYYSDNEGHILIRFTNCSPDKVLELQQGDRFVQGVFLPFGITVDDTATGTRNGGFGSTNTK